MALLKLSPKVVAERFAAAHKDIRGGYLAVGKKDTFGKLWWSYFAIVSGKVELLKRTQESNFPIHQTFGNVWVGTADIDGMTFKGTDGKSAKHKFVW